MLQLIVSLVFLGVVFLGVGVFGSIVSDNNNMEKLENVFLGIAFIGGLLIILPLMIGVFF